MYKKILVPHGGTPAGDEALKHAISAARSSGGRITILHIVEEISHPPTFGLASSEREKLLTQIAAANYSLKKEMNQEMQKRVELCTKEGIKADSKTMIGDAAQAIMDTVKKDSIDLIVMAKRRKLKGVKKLLALGSVSRKIVENVKCAVLLVDIENL